MTIQEIQRLRNEKPFKPFRVLCADGNKYDVWHPEYLGQNPSGRLIMIGLDDDSTVTIDLLLVVAIQRASDDQETVAGLAAHEHRLTTQVSKIEFRCLSERNYVLMKPNSIIPIIDTAGGCRA